MIHSIECEEANQRYNDRYPNHCKSCGGWGGEDYPSTYDNPPDYSPCPKCSDLGKCPMCMEEYSEDAWEDNVLPCGHPKESVGAPGCQCQHTEVCPNCRHDMKYAGRAREIQNEYEVSILYFVCPHCNTETRQPE